MAPTDAVQVDASNAEQFGAWDGEEGAYWAAHADYFDRSASPYHEKLMTAAAIAAIDRVLDIGCGAGQTTRDAARAARAGSALGVDLSSRMIEEARRRVCRRGCRERVLRTGRCADPPVRGRSVRRRDQSFSCDVLRRPGRGVHEPRTRRSGRVAGSC